MKFKVKKTVDRSKAVKISFNIEDYTMIKLKETGKEYPVHNFLAERLVKQGKAEFSKTPIESRETKGVAQVLDVQ